VTTLSRQKVWFWLGLAGTVIISAAVAWWGILFPTVLENTGLSLGQALPCVASNSDVCSLAMATCGADHIFGIRHYSPNLFWVGAVLLCSSLALQGLLPSTRNRF
jgi:hypothetical protein